MKTRSWSVIISAGVFVLTLFLTSFGYASSDTIVTLDSFSESSESDDLGTTHALTTTGRDTRIEFLTEKIRQLEILYQREKLWRIVREIEDGVVELRGLYPKKHIESKALAEDQLKSILFDTMDEYMPEPKIEAYEKVYKLLGFVEGPLDLKKLIVDLLSEQVAGLYDEKTKQLYVMERFDLEEGLSKAILAHEICHSLQDQQYDLGSLPFRDPMNDDLAMAVSAVIEGDAMVLMTEFIADNVGFSILKELPKYLAMDQHVLTGSPYFIQQTLMFPYLNGMNFVNYIRLSGGERARNRLFVDFPKSTEQILHPEKYLSERDDPTPLTLDGFRSFLGDEWEGKIDNVFGEAAIKFLFDQRIGFQTARNAYEGWDGDRYALFENGSGDTIVFWKSVWDSQTDAKEFADAFIDDEEKRYPGFGAKVTGEGVRSISSEARYVAVQLDKKWVRIFVTNQQSLSDKFLEYLQCE